MPIIKIRFDNHLGWVPFWHRPRLLEIGLGGVAELAGAGGKGLRVTFHQPCIDLPAMVVATVSWGRRDIAQISEQKDARSEVVVEHPNSTPHHPQRYDCNTSSEVAQVLAEFLLPHIAARKDRAGRALASVGRLAAKGKRRIA